MRPTPAGDSCSHQNNRSVQQKSILMNKIHCEKRNVNNRYNSLNKITS